MLILNTYLITGSALFVVYMNYRRIENRPLPFWWPISYGRANAVFFQRLLDQLHKKPTESEEYDELLDVPMPAVGEMPTWVKVCQLERETFVQLCDLCETDVVKVEAGEMIPIKGVITEGAAWVLFNQSSSDYHVPSGDISADVQRLTVGDHVDACKIVLVGSLRIVPEVTG